jgi:hypothetical protein
VNQDALESAPGLVAKLCGCDPAPRPHPGPKPVEKSSLRCSGNQITELPAFGTSGCKEIVLPSWSRAHGLILRRLQGRDRLSPDKRGEPVCHRKTGSVTMTFEWRPRFDRLEAIPQAARAKLIHILLLPDLERPSGSASSGGTRRHAPSGELLIDLEDKAYKAVSGGCSGRWSRSSSPSLPPP